MPKIPSPIPSIIQRFNHPSFLPSQEKTLDEKTLNVAIEWLSKNSVREPAYHNALFNLVLCASELEGLAEDVVGRIRDLVSQTNFSPSEQGLLQESLAHFRSPEEKAFAKHLSLKNLACFLGDKVIGNSQLEGNDFTKTAPFLARGIECVRAKHPEEFTPEDKLRVNTAGQQIGAIACLDDSSVESYQNTIAQLKPNQSALIRGGWYGRPTGHALLFHVSLLENEILEWKIINTGSGLEHHTHSSIGGKLYADTITTYHISPSLLKKNKLLQVCSELQSPERACGTYPFNADDLYQHFLPYQVANSKADSENRWMQAQQAGTCAVRSILAFLHWQLGPELYEKLLTLLKEETFVLSLENSESWLTLGGEELKILSSTLPSLFRRMARVMDRLEGELPEPAYTKLKDRLYQARSWQAQLSSMQAVTVFNTIPSPSKRVDCESKRLSKELLTAPARLPKVPLKGKVIKEVPLWPQLPELDSFKTIADITRALHLLNTSCIHSRDIKIGQREGHDMDRLGRFVMLLARHFLDCSELAAGDVPGTAFGQQLLLKAGGKQLKALIDAFAECSATLELNLSGPILMDELNILAINALFLMAWHATGLLDALGGKEVRADSLSYYGIDCSGIERLRGTFAELLPALNRDWEELYAILDAFTSWCNRNKRPKLFNLLKATRTDNLLEIAHLGGELELLRQERKSIFGVFSQGLKECDKAYQLQCDHFQRFSQHKGSLPPLEEWRLAWRYSQAQKNMPAGYSRLLSLAIRTYKLPNTQSRYHVDGEYSMPSLSISEASTGRIADDFVITIRPYIEMSSGSKIDDFNFSSVMRLNLKFDQCLGFLPLNQTSKIPPKESLSKHIAQFGNNEPLLATSIRDTFLGLRRTENDICDVERKQEECVDLSISAYARIFKTGDPGPEVAGLRVALLKDYYSNTPLLFLNWRDQMVFSSALWQSSILSTALEENRYMGDELYNFLRSTRAFISDYFKTSELHDPRVPQAIAFLIENEQRLLQWRRSVCANQQALEKDISRTQGEIQALINDPSFASRPLQLHLHLALLESFAALAIGTLSNEQAKELLLAYHQVRGMLIHEEVRGAHAPCMQRPALRTYDLHDSSIRLYLNSESKLNSLATRIAAYYGISLEYEASWTYACPCLVGKGVDGARIVLDLDTGRATKDGVLLSSSPPNLKADPLYQQVFKEKDMKGNIGEHYIAGEDELGFYRIHFREKEKPGAMHSGHSVVRIDRNLSEGGWFSYVPDEERQKIKLPFIPACASLSLWRSLQDPSDYRALDSETGNLAFSLNSQGNFVFPDGRVREWVDITAENRTGLTRFDGNLSLWQALSPSNDKELLFPSYQDAQGNGLLFEQQEWVLASGASETRWVWIDEPHLSIAPLQRLAKPRGFSHFLILESISGRKEVLIPKHPIAKVREWTDPLGSLTECLRVPLVKGRLCPNSSEQAIYMAYLSLHYAQAPSDYVQALDYLEEAFKDGSYSSEELRLLGWVFTGDKEGVDSSGFADSVRLFAAWLVKDNALRTNRSWPEPYAISPKESTDPEREGPPQLWENFWSSDHIHKEILNLGKHYAGRHSTIPARGRIDCRLDGQAWLDFQLSNWGAKGSTSLQDQSIHTKRPVVAPAVDALIDAVRTAPSKAEPVFEVKDLHLNMLREDPSQWQERFWTLYKFAESGSEEECRELLTHVKALISDPDPMNAAINLAVLARLSKLDQALKHSSADKINHILPQFEKLSNASVKHNRSSLASCLEQYAVHLRHSLGSNSPISSHKSPLGRVLFPARTPPTLPTIPPKLKTLSFEASNADIQLIELQSLLGTYLERVDLKEPPEGFEGNGADELNSELEKGKAANRAKAEFKLKEGLILAQVPSEVLKVVNPLIEADRSSCNELESTILRVANLDPESRKLSMKRMLQESLGLRERLTLDDCIALFLQENEASYKQNTSLDKSDQIEKLFHMTGRFVILHRRLNHLEKVANAAERIQEEIELDGNNPCQRHLADLGTFLEQKNLANELSAPVVGHVFQYYSEIYMKEHQVEGIEEMLPKGKPGEANYQFPQVFLRRLQGEGKSFIIAPLKALLNADGFHLSIHVPPSPLFDSVVAEMRLSGKRLFRQKNTTLSFDDAPEKFTSKYLNWMKGVLCHAVVNREFVTITQESLRSILAKVNKTRIQIEILGSKPSSDRKQITRLEQSCSELESILELIQERAIFTFDEVHTATDPHKELNMPVGLKTSPSVEQATLVSAITAQALSCRETEKNIKEELLDSVLKDPQIVTILGISSISKSEMQEVKNYVLGDREEPPELILRLKQNAKAQPGPAEHIVLLRALITNGWLEDALERRIDEEHGIDLTPGKPKVSIPFAGNNNPLVGSEWSDTITTFLLTFMAYGKGRLSDSQAEKMFASWIESAQIEFVTKSKADTSFRLEDTQAACAFKELMGLSLSGFDIQAGKDALCKRLAQGDLTALQIIYHYVVHHELNTLESYEQEVCANGQNLCTLGKVSQGFSGTFFKNMEPFGVHCSELPGTDGQTIDVLLRRSPEVCVVEGPDDVIGLSIIASRHCQDIRAFIDTGAIFVGLDNASVARKFAQTLPGTISGVKAILYFDQRGNGYWMSPNGQSKRLSAITAAVIEEETGLRPEEIFTYYDQIHCTGTNIKQAPSAVAVVSWGDQTVFTEDAAQGVRRMRGLDAGQKIISCVTKEALHKMEELLGRPLAYSLGDFSSSKDLSVRDLIQHSYLKQIQSEQGRSLDYCQQKLRNVFQLAEREKRFQLNPTERQLFFNSCSFLVREVSGVRLWEDHAFPPKSMETEAFLLELIERYTVPLIESSAFSPAEIKEMREKANVVVAEALPYLADHILVSGAFDSDKSIRTALRRGGLDQKIQVREQERQLAEVKESQKQNVKQKQIQVKRNSSQYLGKLRSEKILTPEQILSEDFLKPTAEKTKGLIPIVRYGQLLEELNVSQELASFLGTHICTTKNFAYTYKDFPSLLDKNPKRVMSFLLVKEDDAEPWKVLLCSAVDSQQVYKTLKALPSQGPKGRHMILVRPNLAPIVSVNPQGMMKTVYGEK